MNKLDEVWVEWVEPFGPNNEPVYMRVPASTAIAVSKTNAKNRGKSYPNDYQALEDFVAVHCATRMDKGWEKRVEELKEDYQNCYEDLSYVLDDIGKMREGET